MLLLYVTHVCYFYMLTMYEPKIHHCPVLFAPGLMDDDFGMELLVAGKIIDLSLPITAVYEGVWVPYVSGATGRGSSTGAGRFGSSRGAGAGSGALANLPMGITFR